ncbi:MAG: hypothetical protein C4529_15015 [Deltaproteobacteria bacterium]|nr:MAG: hypothetical protein C4529_15015 [Deltaproteobacteria bacterium]
MNRCLIELVEADGGSILLNLDLGRIMRLERIRIPEGPHPNRLVRIWRLFVEVFFLPPARDRRFDYRWTTEKGVRVCYENRDREPVEEEVRC